MDAERLLSIARGVIERESASVAALAVQLDGQFIRVVQLVYECRGHILVSGAGTSHAVAARLAHLLSCCGTPALFLHPGDGQHGLSGAITERDVLIALSKGGETAELNVVAQISKQRGAQVIGFTEKSASTLGKLADALLVTHAAEGVDPYGLIATGSSLTTAALCDALCVALLEMRGYSKESFAVTHPGGAVGDILRREGTAQ